MNYLQLVRQLRQECGVSGNPPATVIGQVGEIKRLVDWIRAAWIEIQGMNDDWGFMREQFSFTIEPNVGDYTADGGAGVGASLTDLRYWHRDTLRLYETSLGTNDEQFLVEFDYQVFRNTYRFQAQTPGRPMVFAVNPKGKGLLFGPVPDRDYTVEGEYQRVPFAFELDTDTPDMPEHLHIMIVYKAMQYYGYYEAANEVLARGERMFKALESQLDREQLPRITLGAPLA